ncbi:hypothetical protein KVR01_006302 [Diaporthe batatas]|uniref:uncharacterized protein n=1 Tax=Diaporthe batatas TaxID=748121 RepID=UPI001D04D2C1|nr:uncharacterized protein KVR01_006302 [Diaporthe batatas]KAG8164384.1 hypothetical protein KVR01_006302 [Diaporthe batatas]
MINSLVRAMCLMTAATTAIAMPNNLAGDGYGRSDQTWPFSELIHEPPIDFHTQRQAAGQQGPATGGGSRTQSRPPCAPETPAGLGERVSNPDTAAAFLAHAPFQAAARSLGVSNASFLAQSTNGNGAFQYAGNAYLGWINQPAYSPWNCSLACDALNAAGTKCNSYNTYFLRSPTLAPGTACPNPVSMTTIVCALWKNKLYWTDGLNTNQNRSNFNVVIAGSNLYQRNNLDP